jgi:hypothetical protein
MELTSCCQSHGTSTKWRYVTSLLSQTLEKQTCRNLSIQLLRGRCLRCQRQASSKVSKGQHRRGIQPFCCICNANQTSKKEHPFSPNAAVLTTLKHVAVRYQSLRFAFDTASILIYWITLSTEYLSQHPVCPNQRGVHRATRWNFAPGPWHSPD